MVVDLVASNVVVAAAALQWIRLVVSWRARLSSPQSWTETPSSSFSISIFIVNNNVLLTCVDRAAASGAERNRPLKEKKRKEKKRKEKKRKEKKRKEKKRKLLQKTHRPREQRAVIR